MANLISLVQASRFPGAMISFNDRQNTILDVESSMLNVRRSFFEFFFDQTGLSAASAWAEHWTSKPLNAEPPNPEPHSRSGTIKLFRNSVSINSATSWGSASSSMLICAMSSGSSSPVTPASSASLKKDASSNWSDSFSISSKRLRVFSSSTCRQHQAV